MDNVIPADFSPDMFMDVVMTVKQYGFEHTKKTMLKAEYHPSFVNAILKKVLKRNAW